MKQLNGVQNYDRMLYESGPIDVYDFISNVPNQVHQKLYEDALSKFYIDYPKFKDNKNIRIIEIKAKEYWQPSKIRVIDFSRYPRKYYNFSLDIYWNNIYVEKEDSKIIERNVDEHSEIDYLDYIHGTATMKGRYTNDTFKVNFKDLSYNVGMTDNYDIYDTTFAYLNSINQRGGL